MNPALDVSTIIDAAVPQAVARQSGAPPLAGLPTRGQQIVFEVVESDVQPTGAPGARYTTCSALSVQRALDVRVRVAGNGADVHKAHAASARIMPLFVAALRASSEWGQYEMIQITDSWSAPEPTVGDDGITPTGWVVTLPVTVDYSI